MMWLRQSTASQEILLGPFLDSTDGVTAETALTIANTDIKLWVEGGTTEASKNSGGATHIASGRYYAVLDATDTATLGKLEVNVHVSGALPVRREFMVLPAMIYDSLILGTDRFDVNVTHVGDTAQTANDNGADLSTITGADGVTLATAQGLYAPAKAGDSMALTAEAVDAILDEAIAGHLGAGTAGLYLAIAGGVLVDTTITGTPTSTTFDFTGGATVTDFYQDQVAWIISGTGIGQARPILNSSYSGGTTTITVEEAYKVTPVAGDRVVLQAIHVHPKAQITADIDANSTKLAALIAGVDLNADQTGATIGAVSGAVGSVTGAVGSVTGNVGGNVAGSVASVTGAVGSVTGDVGGNVTGSIGSLAAQAKADVNAECDTALADYDAPTNAEMEARTPTAAQLAYIVSNAADGLPVTFTGGTTTTAILGNVDGSAASSTNDVYNGRILVFNAGTLNQQVTDIIDYDGATKTATITAVTTAVTASHTANMK